MPTLDERTKVDLRQCVEGDGGIRVIRSAGNCRSWNNIQYKAGMSAKNVGSTKLSMNVATIPPGGVAYAHIHVGFELMLYILEGRVRHEYGPGCKQSIENERGRLHLHRAWSAARGVQPEQHRAGGRRGGPLRRKRVGEHRPVRPEERHALTDYGCSRLHRDERPCITGGREDLRRRASHTSWPSCG